MSEEKKGSKVSKPFFTGKYAQEEVFKPIKGTSPKEAISDITPEEEPETPTFVASLYGEPRGVVNSSGNPLRKTGAVRQIDHDPPQAVPIEGIVPNYERKVTWDPESLPTGSVTTTPNPKKVKRKKPKVITTRKITTKF